MNENHVHPPVFHRADRKGRVMKYVFAVLIVLIFLFLRAAVHADIGLSGSAYNETSLISHDRAIRYGNRSDLHLKAIGLSKGAKLVAELDFYTLHGYFASLTAEDGQEIAIASQLLKDGQFYIDRLYLKFPVLNADVTLGKQRIAWGSSVVFSPTDNFNRPNPLSLSGRKEGTNAVLTKIFIGSLSSLEFVMAPADVFKRIDGEINLERLKYSKFASRLMLNKFETDMAFSYQYDGESMNHICGLDFKGDLELGYHLETVFVYNRDEFRFEDMDDYWQSALGLDYSFRSKWFLLGEYFYNGSGRAEKIELSASNFSLLDEFEYRHYLYSQITYQRDIFLTATFFLLWNMVDGSIIASPGVKYSFFQNTDLDLYGQFFFGDENDEYGPERLGGEQVYYLKLTVKF